jgi:hypothetical protein
VIREQEGTVSAPANPPAVRVPARVLAVLLLITLSCPTALRASPAGPDPASRPGPGVPSVVADNVDADATSSNNQVKLIRDPSGTLIAALVVNVDRVPQVALVRSQDSGGHWVTLAQASSGPIASRLPALGLDASGAVHVVWTRYDDGVGKIYYRLWRQGHWTAPQERISPPHGYAGFPSLAVDPAGHPHVVWYGIREGTVQGPSRHSSIYEIFYTGFDGLEWSAPKLISTGFPDAINPALAADRAGRLYAAWFQSDGRVYQVRYAVRAAAWTEPETILATRADAFNPDLAVRPGGQPEVAWEQHEGQASFIRATSRTGSRWDDPADLSDPHAQALHPSVAAGPRDAMSVAWETGDGQIFVRRFTERWQPAIRVTTDGGNTFPSIAALETGVGVAWTHTAEGRASVRYLRLAPAPAGGPGGLGGRASLGALALLLAMLLLARLRLGRARTKPA